MSDINSVFITGNLGQDPEIKYFESGKVVSNFNVAVNEYQGKDKDEKTNWISCRAWGKKAEFISEYAKTGSFVMIHGHLGVDEWQADDGTTKRKVFINVDEIKVVSKK